MTQKEITSNYNKLLPIIGNSFCGVPLYVSLGDDSEYYHLFAHVSQTEFQKRLDKLILSKDATWSISGYLENRAAILKNYPQMVADERFYHLGIDINLPRGSKLFAPDNCEIVLSKYEDGEGNYGGVTVLKFQDNRLYYMLFGHLNPDRLLTVGTMLKKGDSFAVLGDMNQNGNWYCHTHLQVLTPPAYEEGWAAKGYCKKEELSGIENFCPNPLSMLF